MKIIHQKLTQKSRYYRKWHEHPRHAHWHWLSFGLVFFVSTSVIAGVWGSVIEEQNSVISQIVDVRLARAQTCDPANQTSTGSLKPPNYRTFQPPAVGDSYNDPVFCTKITTLTDNHSEWGWNGEIARFNADDTRFFVGMLIKNWDGRTVWLFDGNTGEYIRDLPFRADENMWWSPVDPDLIYYFDSLKQKNNCSNNVCMVGPYSGQACQQDNDCDTGDNELWSYFVSTDTHRLVKEFTEYSEIGSAGADGNDISDNGRYLILDGGNKNRPFAFDLIDKTKGAVCNLSNVDFVTISPSGNYIIVVGDKNSGIFRYDRNCNNSLQLDKIDPHIEIGFDGAGNEILITGANTKNDFPQDPNLSNIDLGDIVAVNLSDGKVTELLDVPTWSYAEMGTIARINRSNIYIAFESRGVNPDGGNWPPYFGEIVEIPLDGSQNFRRLVHHRARPSSGNQIYVEQPEAWINHAGTKIFFKSNMFMQPSPPDAKGNEVTFGSDLFMFDVTASGSPPPPPNPQSPNPPNLSHCGQSRSSCP